MKKSTFCCNSKAVSSKVASPSLVNAGLSCDSHSTNTYLFTSGANRGKISLPGVIILKYLPLNCLLVSLLYKSDNEMNLNDCDRGTVPRWLVEARKRRAPVSVQTTAAFDNALWWAWDQALLIGPLSIWFGNNNWDCPTHSFWEERYPWVTEYLRKRAWDYICTEASINVFSQIFNYLLL